jgi:hypothetical protein
MCGQDETERNAPLLEMLYCSVTLCVRQCSFVFSLHSSAISIPCVCMYYMLRPIAVIIRYTELLQSPFFLCAVPPYTGQCLHIGSALYRYVAYVIPLCYKMY